MKGSNLNSFSSAVSGDKNNVKYFKNDSTHSLQQEFPVSQLTGDDPNSCRLPSESSAEISETSNLSKNQLNARKQESTGVKTTEKCSPTSYSSLRQKKCVEISETVDLPTVTTVSLLGNIFAIIRLRRSLFVRIMAVIYFGVLLFWTFFSNRNNYMSFFIYLTNWGWTAEFVYFALSLWDEILLHKGKKQFVSRNANKLGIGNYENRKISTVSQIGRKITLQMLAEVVFVVQIVVVFFYWSIVFPKVHPTGLQILWELQFHGMGLVLILLDYAYRRVYGFSLKNHKYVFYFGCLYLMCHLVVVFVSGKPIYPGIDFKDFRSFLITMGALSTLVFTHKLIYIHGHWKRIKSEVKTIHGLAKLLLFRSDSLDASRINFLWNKLRTIPEVTRTGSHNDFAAIKAEIKELSTLRKRSRLNHTKDYDANLDLSRSSSI